jgi:hypothetical protein
MASDAILSEVEHLNGVCERLEGLADRTPRLSTELLTIAGTVRSSATLLAVLVATRLHRTDEDRSGYTNAEIGSAAGPRLYLGLRRQLAEKRLSLQERLNSFQEN